MEVKCLKIGEFVISRAGRDKGKLLIVVERVDDTFVRVVDGDLRRMNHPKLKKMMHLNLVNYKDEALAKALESGETITDHSIRKSIENYRNVTKPPRRE